MSERERGYVCDSLDCLSQSLADRCDTINQCVCVCVCVCVHLRLCLCISNFANFFWPAAPTEAVKRSRPPDTQQPFMNHKQ